jgi:hypothetical protein
VNGPSTMTVSAKPTLRPSGNDPARQDYHAADVLDSFSHCETNEAFERHCKICRSVVA